MFKLNNKKNTLLIALCTSAVFLSGCANMHQAMETGDKNKTVAQSSDQQGQEYASAKTKKKSIFKRLGSKKSKTQETVAQETATDKTVVDKGIATAYKPTTVDYTTASGEAYDITELTAAHDSLPLGSYFKVVNLTNGKEAIVKVNDRGTKDGSVINLSYAAAYKLGIKSNKKVPVEVIALSNKSFVTTESITDAQAMTKEDSRKLSSKPRREPASVRSISSSTPAETTTESLAPSAQRSITINPANKAGLTAAESTFMDDDVTSTYETTASTHKDVSQTASESTAKTTTDTGIFLQIGSFRSKDNAEKLIRQTAQVAKSSDSKLEIYEFNVDDRPMYKVRLGPVENFAAARDLEEKLAEKNIQSLTVRN